MKKLLIIMIVTLLAVGHSLAAELWVGAAAISITPEQPVSLAGQMHNRIARSVESPCMAGVLALESRAEGKDPEQAMLISLDLVCVSTEMQRDFRAYVAPLLAGFDTNKLFLAATHTHTAPTPGQEWFADYEDAMQPKEYLLFLYQQLAEAVVKAWEGRKPGGVAWGLGHAVVGHNRRVAYADGTAAMYGQTEVPNFRQLEGGEDHSVDILCFTDAEKQLIATAITVPCPAQTVEGITQVSADYWHHVREGLHSTYGEELVVLGFSGPAGDLMPRPMLRKAAEGRMEQLRKISRKQEVGRRIVRTFDETWEAIRQDIRMDLPLVHRVERFTLPKRKMTDAEAQAARNHIAEYAAQRDAATDATHKASLEGFRKWFQNSIDMYEAQQRAEIFHQVEMHVLRLGDVAIATTSFEMFQDYAMRIQGGRSKALQTILIQLASPVDTGTYPGYLASERAVKGGGYSAIPQSTPVGPEGGQMLVEKTLSVINELFQ